MMDIGIVGLGKMGYELALNMRDQGLNVVATNRSPEKVDEIKKEGVRGVYSLEDLVSSFGENRRVIWLMVPAGKAVDDNIGSLVPLLNKGDIIIDGGNSNFNDSIKRYNDLKHKGIEFLDVGTSGGTSGARHGACLMVGGDSEPAGFVEPMLKKLAIKDGYGYFGSPGSGHYVKMIHNGIEYGMMQAIGEGFDILKASEFDLDFELVSKVWSNGSIIEGLLMRLMHEAFKQDPNLDAIVGKVDASGEADWTVQESIRLKVSAPVITQSLFTRFKSKDDERFSEKSVAALRNQFGGHKVYKA